VEKLHLDVPLKRAFAEGCAVLANDSKPAVQFDRSDQDSLRERIFLKCVHAYAGSKMKDHDVILSKSRKSAVDADAGPIRTKLKASSMASKKK